MKADTSVIPSVICEKQTRQAPRVHPHSEAHECICLRGTVHIALINKLKKELSQRSTDVASEGGEVVCNGCSSVCQGSDDVAQPRSCRLQRLLQRTHVSLDACMLRVWTRKPRYEQMDDDGGSGAAH